MIGKLNKQLKRDLMPEAKDASTFNAKRASFLGLAMMQKGLTLALIFGLSFTSVFTFASPTQAAVTSISRELPFSARLATTDNIVAPNGEYTLTFRLYTVASGGTAVWTEEQTVSVTDGAVFARLGVVTALPSTLNFNGSDYYLGVTIAGEPGELSPRRHIGAVPTAMNADTVDGAHAGTTANTVLKLNDSGNIDITGGAALGGSLAVTGASSLSSTLSVTGNATFDSTTLFVDAANNRVGIGNAAPATLLHLTGVTEQLRLGYDSTNFSSFTTDSAGRLTINPTGGQTTITGTLVASSGSSLSGQTTITSTSTPQLTLRYDASNYFGQSVSSTGAVTLDATGSGASFAINDAVTLASTLGVTGATTLSSTLAVSGASTLNSLAVTNNATVGGTLGVTGASTLSSTLGVTGATTLSSTLAVTGATTLSSTLAVTGATTLSSTLAVTGASTLSGLLTANGGITADGGVFTVADTTGNVATSGTLAASGATTLSSTLGVTGATTLSSTLAVTGNATFDTNTLFVDAANNRVGIGTTGPNEQLELTGNFRLPVTTSSAGVIKVGGSNFIHTAGTENTFVGVGAGNLTTSGVGKSVAIGTRAFDSVTTGYHSVAIGVDALQAETTGGTHVALGYQALFNNNGSTNNTALGAETLTANTSGSHNTAVGHGALYAVTTGSRNIGIGKEAGGASHVTGSNSIFIGNGSGPTVDGLTNAIAIGDSATVSASNSIVLGSGANVGIGVSSPATKLHVLATTEQLRLGYDATNYSSFTTNASGQLTINPSGGQTTITGTLISSSASTLNGQTTITSTSTPQLTIRYDASNYLTQAVSSAGAVTLDATGASAGFTIVDATSLSSTLAVSGATTLSSTLAVTGASTLTGLLTANGGITADGGVFTVADTSGNVATSGTLGVTGATTLSSTLAVTGATTLSSTLAVTGNATFDTNTLFVDAANNRVGIGTAAPDYILDVQSSDTSFPLFRAVRATTSRGITLDSNGILQVQNDGTGSTGAAFTSTLIRGTSGSGSEATGLNVIANVTIAAGTDTNQAMLISGAINQTGGTGVVKGLAINPTLTSLTGTYRAIDIMTNSASAYGIYQSGASTLNYFAGATTFNSTVTSGATTLSSLTVTNNATVGGTLGVTGATTLSSTLGVPVGSVSTPSIYFGADSNSGLYSVADGTVSYVSNGTTLWLGAANTGVTPTKAFRLDDSMGIGWSTDPDNQADEFLLYRSSASNLRLTNGSATSNPPNLIVDGNITASGTLNATGATTLSSTLAVTGASTFTGLLTANGGITADGGVFTVADTSGNVATSGTLNVTGATVLSSTLAVTSNATFDTDTLFVDATNNRVGVGTASPGSQLHVVGGTSGSSTDHALNVTGTLAADTSMVGVKISVTGNTTTGVLNIGQNALESTLLAGNISNEGTAGVFGINDSTGGNSGVPYNNASRAAAGLRGYAQGASPQNAGVVGLAYSATDLNMGVIGTATIGGAGKNIGVAGVADGSTTNNIGGYFALAASSASYASAAILADNGSTAAPIFIGKDNGTTVFTIADGGAVDINSTLQLNATGTATTNGLCHSGVNSDTTFTDREVVACSGAPADIAEWYPTQSGVEAGHIVAASDQTMAYQAEGADPETGLIRSLGTQNITIMKKAAANDRIFGVISTAPFQTFGRDIRKATSSAKPVALVGRVPVKVAGDSAAISRGDLITVGSESGKAAKLTGAGWVIGRALEDWTAGQDKLLLYVNTPWYYSAGLQEATGTFELINSPAGKNLTIATPKLVISGRLEVSQPTVLASILVTKPSVLQTVAANGQIAANATKIKVAGVGGAVEMIGQPQIPDGEDGQLLIVQGIDDATKLTVKDQSVSAGSNLELGASTRALGKGDILTLTYDANDGVWYEVSYTDN